MNWSVLCSEVVFWLLLLCICGFSDGPNLNMFELGFLFEVWSSVLEELNSMFIVHRRFEVGFWQGFNQIFGRTFAILLKFLIRKVWIRFFIWGSPGSKFEVQPIVRPNFHEYCSMFGYFWKIRNVQLDFDWNQRGSESSKFEFSKFRKFVSETTLKLMWFTLIHYGCPFRDLDIKSEKCRRLVACCIILTCMLTRNPNPKIKNCFKYGGTQHRLQK